MNLDEALGIVRLLIARGVDRQNAIENSAIAIELREQISEALAREDNITLEPARYILVDRDRGTWIRDRDRSTWYYWQRLREYLLGRRNWDIETVRSLDEITDRILGQLAPPELDEFDIRGLVLGFVQSGKTANYTALIAKAADVGYRLVVVLAGIDNGLRLQTQIRLKQELVGYVEGYLDSVPLPPMGKQWHEFTREMINGDFHPGYANQAALQGSQPVLLVVKKNGPVLRRLISWLENAQEEVRTTIPLLVIDDEADQASIDTRGTYQIEDEDEPDEYDAPSVINGLIRNLLRRFRRSAYIAYTATPFANILIPHDTFDPQVQNDLYPKDFIIDLPQPNGYFGAERLFGYHDAVKGEEIGGLGIVRIVPKEDLATIEHQILPPSLEDAIIDFVLAGAAKTHREKAQKPATMLVHVSRLINEQMQLARIIEERFSALRDEWRYQRNDGIKDRLRERWEAEFRPFTRSLFIDRDISFESLEKYLGPFFESVQVRVVNSFTGDVLDYVREPALTAIAVGGNRFSRGLTLEGLLISYFARRSVMYDTLIQMGRWFGYRSGYEDLTRIYTTAELNGWFIDLAFVEKGLREDLQIYEAQGLTPEQVGMRIWQHPAMQVTSPLKRRFARDTVLSQSYSLTVQQTFKFPLHRLDDLAKQTRNNVAIIREFLTRLGRPSWEDNQPLWKYIPPDVIMEFLSGFQIDPQTMSISLPLIISYIDKLIASEELTNWTVAILCRKSPNDKLGIADWGIEGGQISQISRSRIFGTDSLGVITSPGDEAMGLPNETMKQVDKLVRDKDIGINPAARRLRPAEEGLLLLYPISRNSGYDLGRDGNRCPLYTDTSDARALDLAGLAISFPESRQKEHVEAYLEGTVGWQPVL